VVYADSVLIQPTSVQGLCCKVLKEVHIHFTPGLNKLMQDTHEILGKFGISWDARKIRDYRGD
jgi:hypothetical protein